jgi:hypothetical protein
MVLLQIILIYRYINLRLEPLVKLIQDKCLLVDFLLQRKDSKPVVIQVHSLVSYCVCFTSPYKHSGNCVYNLL